MNWRLAAAAAVILVVAVGCVTRQDTIGAINADRAAVRVPAVQEAADLTWVAQNWADHLRDTNSFYHEDLSALRAWSPYSAMGETLAHAPFDDTGAQVEAIWMSDPTHRAIVLESGYGFVGIGIASDQTSTWVVAVFGGR